MKRSPLRPVDGSEDGLEAGCSAAGAELGDVERFVGGEHEADEVADLWLHAVDLMLDAGHCAPGPTSIIDCMLPTPEVVRQGFQPMDVD